MSECDHTGHSCPVHHVLWDPEKSEAGGMEAVLLCLYGGVETKDGSPFDATDAKEVMERVFERLLG